jgi:hypothetical protein
LGQRDGRFTSSSLSASLTNIRGADVDNDALRASNDGDSIKDLTSHGHIIIKNVTTNRMMDPLEGTTMAITVATVFNVVVVIGLLRCQLKE